jgi:hypothetical protein
VNAEAWDLWNRDERIKGTTRHEFGHAIADASDEFRQGLTNAQSNACKET